MPGTGPPYDSKVAAYSAFTSAACLLQIEKLSFLKIELHLTNTANKKSALWQAN